jgi:hypothetical protein
MRKQFSQIPLCKSAFLQDITIELGRLSLKSARYNNRLLTFEALNEEVAGEKLTKHRSPWIWRHFDKNHNWEDGESWLYFREPVGKHQKALEMRRNLKLMPAGGIAYLVRDTPTDYSKARARWENA